MKLPSKLKIISLFVLLAILFLILNLTSFSKEIKNFFYLISSPFQKILWQAGERTSDFLAGILKAGILEEENKKLYIQNKELVVENISLKELKKENQILRQALDLGLEKSFELSMAQVVNKDISQDTLLINKGGKDGILEGLPVISSQKVLVGKIGKVYDDFSEVILISDKDSSFDAKISEKEIYGLIKGKGNLEFYLDFIPKDKQVFENDAVVTAALGKTFPAGLLVGEIKSVKKSDVDPWQTAEVKASFQISDLDILFIIKDF